MALPMSPLWNSATPGVSCCPPSFVRVTSTGVDELTGPARGDGGAGPSSPAPPVPPAPTKAASKSAMSRIAAAGGCEGECRMKTEATGFSGRNGYVSIDRKATGWA